MAGTAAAQLTPQVNITAGGQQTYCNVELFDSGGPNGNYSNNENMTITFCPGTPGDVLQFSASTLLLGGPGDVLTVYEGASATGVPLAATDLTGPQELLAGQLFTSTAPDGCLTIRFTSNGTGVAAGWQALIQCAAGCPEPTASFPPFPESPYRICPYDTLSLDASGSTALPGRSLVNYAWSIAGTTTYSPTTQVELPTPVPGEFAIALQVVDDIGCASTNSSAELVRVSTYPDYTGSGIAPSTICRGESATLTGSVEGTLWSSVPQPIVSGTFVLPDACPDDALYQSTINVSGFPAGTTINGATDILEVCLVMEHSFLGDLTVSLSCPDGQSIVLFDGFNNGGGGTYLGSPLDGSVGVPGQGFEYCFSMNAAWGTIEDENQLNNHVTAGDPEGDSMTPGTYTPTESFSNWDGCNLNGGWTLSVLDQLCLDDGVIFSASMSINPALYPDVIEYTPVVGINCDSANWSGPDIVSTTPDCSSAMVTPTAPGAYGYTYTVTDDFGCTFDSTFTLTVTPGAVFEATAGPPCIAPVQMGVDFDLPIPSGTLTYQWSPATSLSNPNVAFPTATPTVDTWYRLHVFPAGHPLCGIVDSVFVPRVSNLVNDSVITDVLCFGEANGTITVNTVGTGGPWNYEWSTLDGYIVRSTTGSNGDMFQGPVGTYRVVITEGPNGTGCVDSLDATIAEPPLLELTGISADTTICINGSTPMEATVQGGTPPLILHWDQGLAGNGPFVVTPVLTTLYTVYATDANDCRTAPRSTTVTVRDSLHFTLPDTLSICPGIDTTLTAVDIMGGDGQYTFDWGGSLPSDPMRPVDLTASQDLCVTVRDGCETPPVEHCTHWIVKEVPPLVLTADTVLGCAPFLVHFTLEDTSGAARVDWDFGIGEPLLDGPTERDVNYTRSGHFDVSATVHWPNYCNVDTFISDMIVVEPLPTADFVWTPYPATILEPEVHFVPITGPYATSWTWTFHDGDTTMAREAAYTFPSDIGGVYPVELLTTNYLGCADSTTKLVEVHGAFLVYAPSAFSPDGDGVNDGFRVLGNDISTTNFELSIYDRWGHRLFATTDRQEAWDGTSGGDLVPQGTYVWKIKARSAYTDQDDEFLGHVTLVR